MYHVSSVAQQPPVTRPCGGSISHSRGPATHAWLPKPGHGIGNVTSNTHSMGQNQQGGSEEVRSVIQSPQWPSIKSNTLPLYVTEGC